MRTFISVVTIIGVLVIGVVTAGAGTQLPISVFDQQLAQMRFDNSSFGDEQLMTVSDNRSSTGAGSPKRLSPGKAFAMSLVVPGLGQYYTGNKIKAAGFFALDVTAWILHFKARSDGNDLTDKFEAFQQAHWSRVRYADYLDSAYGYRDDDSIQATEVSHHLPDGPTQQYYEMTGKYDQFSWGWDDARLNGSSLYELTVVLPAIGVNIPTSANRNAYEIMRENANHKFDVADKWLIVSLANHVISAFEAALSARRKNNSQAEGSGFGRVTVRADLKSFAMQYDTPYLRCSYAF